MNISEIIKSIDLARSNIVNELDTTTLTSYARKAAQINPKDSMGKVAKHTAGAVRAIDKIATKTGDKTFKHGQTRKAVFTESYNDLLHDLLKETFQKYDFNEEAITDILNRQHADNQLPKKREVVSINYHGWDIKYRKAGKPGDAVDWIIFDRKGNKVGSGTATTEKDAVNDAQQKISSAGGSGQDITSNSVTIDFNVPFSRHFIHDGIQMFATIDYDESPILILSGSHLDGFKRIYSGRQPKSGGTGLMHSMNLSGAEAKNAHLSLGGRYVIGDKISDDGETAWFQLILVGETQSVTDKQRLGVPGLTVARPQNTR